MSDRLQEIRARLDARAGTVTGTNERVVLDGESGYRVEDDAARANQVFHRNAVSDIAWLLRQVANERADNALHEDDIYDLRDQVNALWDIVHEQDITGVLDIYEERLKAQRRMRRPHGD